MKRRFVQDPITLELIEVPHDYIAPRGGGVSGDATLWNDRSYQDGGDPRFSSRTEHRDYMRQHGLTTVDDYLGAQWRKDEQRRADIRHGVDPSRKQDLINAVHKLRG